MSWQPSSLGTLARRFDDQDVVVVAAVVVDDDGARRRSGRNTKQNVTRARQLAVTIIMMKPSRGASSSPDWTQVSAPVSCLWRSLG